jgi:hypothetical protein
MAAGNFQSLRERLAAAAVESGRGCKPFFGNRQTDQPARNRRRGKDIKAYQDKTCYLQEEYRKPASGSVALTML